MNFQELALMQEAVRRSESLRKETLEIHSTVGDVEKAIRILNHLSPIQKKFVLSPSKMKTALCTRRAGKTTSVAAAMLYTCIANDNCEVGYFAPTAKQARGIIRKQLIALHKKYDIAAEWHEQRAEFTYPNGSLIALVGASDSGSLANGIGHAFHLIVIDESGSFGPHLRTLIVDSLLPTLADYNGSLWMIGVPQGNCMGYFYDVTTGVIQGDWERFEWSVFDNPYLPEFVKFKRLNPDADWQEWARTTWLDALLAKSGQSREDPDVQRAWFGKWVRDDSSLVYHYDPSKNRLLKMPENVDWRMVLGVDFGQLSALVVVAYSPSLPYCVILKAERVPIKLTDDLAEHIKMYRRKFPRIYRIVADCGNMAVQLAADMRARHNLPIVAAEKRHKSAFQVTMNSDFANGRIKVVEPNCQTLIDCWNTVQKDPADGEELKGQNNHESDAALYAWRFCRHYFSKQPVAELNQEVPEDWEALIEAQLLLKASKPGKVVDELEALYG